MSEHCIACGQSRGSVAARSPRHPLCAWCWCHVPPKMRIALVVTYGRRIRDPKRYQEALATVLRWAEDQRAVKRMD